MKIFVKTLKGTSFEIEVKPDDKVSDVKKSIETSQVENVYPADQQMLIYQGKILKDDTTLEDNKVAESSFLVVMLSKNKGSASGASTAAKTPPTAALASTVPATPAVPAPAPIQAQPSPMTFAPAPTPAAAPTPVTAPTLAISESTDVYGQAASNLVSGSSLEQTVQQIMDMGGGTWERDMVIRALRAAYNNPERAAQYLHSGIPENVEPPPVARAPQSGTGQPAANPLTQATAQPTALPAVPPAGPNANPLDLFPQGLPTGGAGGGAGSLDMLRNSPQQMSDPNIEVFDEGKYESDKDEDESDWSSQVRLKYWCDNCRAEYDLCVDEVVECIEIGHKLYSLDEWKKKKFRDYIVVSFPRDAQEGEHIICCDGSLRKKVFSCAVIFRDNELNFEESLRMVEVNKNRTSIQVEIEAISLAILRAVHVFGKSENKRKCFIYNDCKTAVELYCGGQKTDDNSINRIFTNRKNLIEEEGLEVQIKWICRENNKIADRLAKKTKLGYYISKRKIPLNKISRTLYEEKVLRINHIKLLGGKSPMEEGTRHGGDFDEANLFV